MVIKNLMIEDIWKNILLSFLFTFCLVYDSIHYTQINKLGFLMAIIAFSGLVVYKSMELDVQFLLLFEAFLLVGFHNSRNWVDYEIGYTWILPLAYLLGKIVVGNEKKSEFKYLYFIFCNSCRDVY